MFFNFSIHVTQKQLKNRQGFSIFLKVRISKMFKNHVNSYAFWITPSMSNRIFCVRLTKYQHFWKSQFKDIKNTQVFIYFLNNSIHAKSHFWRTSNKITRNLTKVSKKTSGKSMILSESLIFPEFCNVFPWFQSSGGLRKLSNHSEAQNSPNRSLFK